MNTYRVYVLDTAAELAPVTHVAYVRAEKYGPAWQTARAALNAEKGAILYSDPESKNPATFAKDAVVAKIVDIRPRNVKLDKQALQAILADPKASAEDKLKAITAITA